MEEFKSEKHLSFAKTAIEFYAVEGCTVGDMLKGLALAAALVVVDMSLTEGEDEADGVLDECVEGFIETFISAVEYCEKPLKESYGVVQ